MPSKLKVPEHSTSLSLAFTNMQNFFANFVVVLCDASELLWKRNIKTPSPSSPLAIWLASVQGLSDV